MSLIGNTAKEVRAFIEARYGPAQGSPRPRESRATTIAERELLGYFCRRCGALNELCLSETGLPASGPHLERILDSAT